MREVTRRGPHRKWVTVRVRIQIPRGHRAFHGRLEPRAMPDPRPLQAPAPGQTPVLDGPSTLPKSLRVKGKWTSWL